MPWNNVEFFSEQNSSSFQQAVVRSINDKNAQLQKQLENVVREGTKRVFDRPFYLFLKSQVFSQRRNQLAKQQERR